MKNTVKNQTNGKERAFYGTSDTLFASCCIGGKEDGESAFKECKRIELKGCEMELRYPLWHVTDGKLSDCRMSETCRAPMWYCRGLNIDALHLSGVKAIRECTDVKITNSTLNSAEFGWKTHGFTAYNCDIAGEYLFLDSSDLTLDNIKLTGKYSLQYIKNAVIKNSVLNTKDAFWHSENVTVYDSEINGEYLGWYSKNLRLINCRISGTQPLCYAEGLVLESCTMTGCDLSFERSEVTAAIQGSIDSIKNPVSGRITADSVGEIISEDGRERKTALTVKSPEEVTFYI